MDDAVVRGLLQVVGVSLVPVLLVVLGGRTARAVAWAVDRRRARTGPTSDVRPVESLAADLRRLHPTVHHPPRGTAHAKHQGVVLAYDDCLERAARALGVPASLADLPTTGFDREVERLRLEQRLVDLGLQLRPGPVSDGGTPGR